VSFWGAQLTRRRSVQVALGDTLAGLRGLDSQHAPFPIPKAGPLARPKSAHQVGVPVAATLAAIPADNKQTPEKIALGEKLFFDGRLSVDGTVACSTCHGRLDRNNPSQNPHAIATRSLKERITHTAAACSTKSGIPRSADTALTNCDPNVANSGLNKFMFVSRCSSSLWIGPRCELIGLAISAAFKSDIVVRLKFRSKVRRVALPNRYMLGAERPKPRLHAHVLQRICKLRSAVATHPVNLSADGENAA